MTDTPTSPELRYLPGADGEPLLLPGSTLGLLEKFQTFRESTGVEALRITRLVSTPLVYDRSVRPHGELLGHPLLWLPERLMVRRENEATGELETPDHWSVRVALELTMSGVYSETDGWVDCLSLMGLDPETDAERIGSWAAGGEDEILDTFDLGSLLDVESDLDWSFDVATDMLDQLLEISVALTARSLALTAREALEAPEFDGEFIWNDAERRGVVMTCAALAEVLLSDIEGVKFDELAAAARDDKRPAEDDSDCWTVVTVLEQLDEQFRGLEEEADALFESLLADEEEPDETPASETPDTEPTPAQNA